MIYTLITLVGYTLATCMASVLLFESESSQGPLSQRQALMVILAAIVWPLLAMGILWQCRSLFLNTLKVALDLPFNNFEVDTKSLGSDFNLSPEESPMSTFGFGYVPEELEDYEVDPDTY